MLNYRRLGAHGRAERYVAHHPTISAPTSYLSVVTFDQAQVAWVYVTSRHMSTWRDAWLGNIIFSFFHRSIFQNISHQIPREFEDCTFDRAKLVGQQNMSGFQIGPRENQRVLYGRMCDDLTWKKFLKSKRYIYGRRSSGGHTPI